MVGWNQALCQVIGIFETQQSGLRPVLEPIMHLPHTERPSATPDLKHITRNLLDSLQYAKRAFKRVWYLYTLCHQQHQPIYHSVAMSLNAIQSQFTIHPFAISRPDGSSYAPFSVLNCHQDIEDVEQFSRVLGRDWINRYINSSNAPSELVEAQVSLFGLIWCGTIQRLKANPTHDADDLEYKDFQQTLDQLDRSLQDVIARSMRPRFTISFFGMVKAGKSLFLNAMIGKIVLPSDGECTSGVDNQECLFWIARTTLNSVAMQIGTCQGTRSASASCQNRALRSCRSVLQRAWLCLKNEKLSGCYGFKI